MITIKNIGRFADVHNCELNNETKNCILFYYSNGNYAFDLVRNCITYGEAKRKANALNKQYKKGIYSDCDYSQLFNAIVDNLKDCANDYIPICNMKMI